MLKKIFILQRRLYGNNVKGSLFKVSSNIFQDELNIDGFSCSLCDNIYKLEIMLRLHMAAAHPNQTQHLFNKGTIAELICIRTCVYGYPLDGHVTFGSEHLVACCIDAQIFTDVNPTWTSLVTTRIRSLREVNGFSRVCLSTHRGSRTCSNILLPGMEV